MATSASKTKERIPNKVGWALEDILAHCQGSRADWKKLVDISESKLDPMMALYLARIRDHMAEIQRTAAAAAEGRYDER